METLPHANKTVLTIFITHSLYFNLKHSLLLHCTKVSEEHHPKKDLPRTSQAEVALIVVAFTVRELFGFASVTKGFMKLCFPLPILFSSLTFCFISSSSAFSTFPTSAFSSSLVLAALSFLYAPPCFSHLPLSYSSLFLKARQSQLVSTRE